MTRQFPFGLSSPRGKQQKISCWSQPMDRVVSSVKKRDRSSKLIISITHHPTCLEMYKRHALEAHKARHRVVGSDVHTNNLESLVEDRRARVPPDGSLHPRCKGCVVIFFLLFSASSLTVPFLGSMRGGTLSQHQPAGQQLMN